MRIRLLSGKHSHLRQQLKSKGNIYRTSHYLKACKSEVRTSRLARILDNLNAFLKPQDMNLYSKSYMSFQERKRVPGQFGLPAIGESPLDLTVSMQWPLIIEITIEDQRF